MIKTYTNDYQDTIYQEHTFPELMQPWERPIVVTSITTIRKKENNYVRRRDNEL